VNFRSDVTHLLMLGNLEDTIEVMFDLVGGVSSFSSVKNADEVMPLSVIEGGGSRDPPSGEFGCEAFGSV
jgi:hypothetical protein